jgi:hypothetical protein
MISNDTIHVQIKGREDNNGENISTLEHDYLCIMHDVWSPIKPTPITYK